MTQYYGTNNAGQKLSAVKLAGKTWLVTFEATGSTRKANIDNIRCGKVRDLYAPSRYIYGYDGDFIKVPHWKRAKQLWSNMLKRCYCEADTRGYKDATVSARWHCFANFLSDLPQLNNFDKWLENAEPYELDKDLLMSGNRVYAREHCQFIDRATNRAAGKGGKRLINGEWVTTTR